MAFEDLKARFMLLFTEMENQPEDMHELHDMLHEKLNEMRAMGMPLPEDLVELEQKLEQEFARQRLAGTRPPGRQV